MDTPKNCGMRRTRTTYGNAKNVTRRRKALKNVDSQKLLTGTVGNPKKIYVITFRVDGNLSKIRNNAGVRVVLLLSYSNNV
jgi:hypothetical protein